VSPFTEAHFAATLLECGPHVTGELHTPAYDDYLNAVYSYFFTLFPIKAEFFDTKNGRHEWHVFWQEYMGWVEK